MGGLPLSLAAVAGTACAERRINFASTTTLHKNPCVSLLNLHSVIV